MATCLRLHIQKKQCCLETRMLITLTLITNSWLTLPLITHKVLVLWENTGHISDGWECWIFTCILGNISGGWKCLRLGLLCALRCSTRWSPAAGSHPNTLLPTFLTHTTSYRQPDHLAHITSRLFVLTERAVKYSHSTAINIMQDN